MVLQQQRLGGYSRRLDRIREACPDLEIRQATINNEGLVNDVIIINGERVFRFARADWAIELMHREARCLELAKREVDIRLPGWVVHADDMISYELIPGVALQRFHILGLDDEGQDRLAEQLARFLRQLHAIPYEALEKHHIPQSDTMRTTEDWLQLYEELQQQLFPVMMAYARDWVHHHFTPLVSDRTMMDYQPVFMNGDLGPYHLLFDSDIGRLNGIIDFGSAGIGDPAADFACLIDAYGESFVRRMARYYPAIKGHIERARFWAGTLELQWALHGLTSDDPSWGTVHIGRARDVSPVGSGWPDS